MDKRYTINESELIKIISKNVKKALNEEVYGSYSNGFSSPTQQITPIAKGQQEFGEWVQNMFYMQAPPKINYNAQTGKLYTNAINVSNVPPQRMEQFYAVVQRNNKVYGYKEDKEHFPGIIQVFMNYSTGTDFPTQQYR